ncbi:MAG: hypothetical protein NVSMB42_19290 [Herpetosiphon sp.]
MKARVRFLFGLLTVIVAVGTAGIPRAASAAPAPRTRYFSQTGHNIATRIKLFWDNNGGLPVFGYPLTEVIVENGQQVQYFERARFELHPELPDAFFVSLTHVGRRLVGARTRGAFAPQVRVGGETFFVETHHGIQGLIKDYWYAHGALPVFGFPLSEQFSEVNYADGRPYVVQYFERARMEIHPDLPPEFRIELGLLGSQLLDESPVARANRAAVSPLVVLGTATTGYYGSFAERVSNIAHGAGRMNGKVVQPGRVFSFGDNLGSTNASDGFVDGYAIVNGKLEKVVGGGLCQVSTTLYRAVFYAGLQLVDRTPHTFMINFYENIKGFDATVFTPDVDFKWRNDTGGPVYVESSTNPDQATVTFTLYGWSDGRAATMIGPVESKVVQPGKPNWQFDSSLALGETKQLVHGRPGSDIQMQRIVTLPTGAVLHNDNLPSHYKPWEDFFLYGPGVVPPAGVNIVPGDAKPANATHP